MKYCEELTVLGPVNGNDYDANGRLSNIYHGGYWFSVSEQALQLLDKCVKPYGLNDGEGWLYETQRVVESIGALPWAIVFFDREYKLAGHFIEIKGDSKELMFTWYTVRNIDEANPLDRKYL